MEREGHAPMYLERRAKPRVAVPFQATVSGRDREGTPFEVIASVDNLCSGGLYLKITRDVGVGSKLLINVFMHPTSAALAECGTSLEVYSLVKRVDPVEGGCYGVAVFFTRGLLL